MRRYPFVVALLFLCVAVGCAPSFENAGLSSDPARTMPRDRPDDADLLGLISQGTHVVIDINMASLRKSAWTAEAVTSGSPEERSAKRTGLGYDDALDVDRIVYGVTTLDGSRPTLAVAQGRFERNNVEDAFRLRWSATQTENRRGISLVVAGDDHALAFITPRTFASGTRADVRAVVERAFGLGAGIDRDPGLGPLARACLGSGAEPPPAVFALLAIDDSMRSRSVGTLQLPPGLNHLGIRLDLGKRLSVAALGFMSDGQAADALARELGAFARTRRASLVATAVGLSPLLNHATSVADGSRIRWSSFADDTERAELRQALAAAIKQVAGP